MNHFFFDSLIESQQVEDGIVRKIKAYNDQMMLVELQFSEGAVGDMHTHMHTQLTYCLEGSFEFNIDGDINIINSGDSICMPSDSYHGCKLLSKQGRLLDIFTPYREDFLATD